MIVVRRVVLFRAKPEAEEADFVAALRDLQTLDQRMSGMTSWWVDIHPNREGMWDAVLVADFESPEVVSEYEVHPEHARVASVIGQLSDFAIFDGHA